MNLRNAVFLVLAMPLAITVVTASEAIWPKHPVSEVATFATILRFQIYADHCSGEIPQIAPEFDHLMDDLGRRIRGMSARLLSSQEFNSMKSEMVPVEIMDALKHSFHDLAHNVERLDAESICSTTLQRFRDTDDEVLEASLIANLTAVHTMSQKIEKERAH